MSEYYILKFGNDKYAINKKYVLEVNKAKKISSLNYIRNFLVYITIHKKETIYLYDISNFLDYNPYNTNEPGSFFLLSKDEEIQGFLINEKSIDAQCTAEVRVPVPDAVKNEIIDECIIGDGFVIPVLNIRDIPKNFSKDFSKENNNKYLKSKKNKNTKIVLNNFNVVKIDQYYFAIPDNNNKEVNLKDNLLVHLPFLHSSIKGIVFHDNELIPVINLGSFFSVNNKKNKILIVKESSPKNGFLYNSQKKDITIKKNDIKKLPLILQSKWLNDAIIEKNNFIPIINQSNLFEEINEKTEKDFFLNQYKPSSKFDTCFFKQEIKVLEFSILGFPYALPIEEVEDNFSILPYQEIPTASPMVIGASIHNNEILPVLDIAECFGIKSEIKKNWETIFIKNGNFKALIVTDKIIGEKKITAKDQRLLPIKQNYQFVYGCYLDQDIVKIIMNIEEIVIHFDQIDHKFFKSLAKEVQEKIEDKIDQIHPEESKKADATTYQKEGSEEEVNNKNEISKKDEAIAHEAYKEEQNVSETSCDHLADNQESEYPHKTIINNTPADNIDVKDTDYLNNKPDKTDMTNLYKNAEIVEAAKKEEITKAEERSFSQDTSTVVKGKKKKRLFLVLIFSLLLIFFIPIFLFLSKNFSWQKTKEITKNSLDKKTETKKDKTRTKELSTGEGGKKGQEILINTLEHILFNPDSSELSDNEKIKLDKIGLIIKNYQDHNIVITGHTALAGTETGREYLSIERAEIVGDYLLSHHYCKKEQLSIFGKGATEPIGDNATLEGQKKNRRAEIVITP